MSLTYRFRYQFTPIACSSGRWAAVFGFAKNGNASPSIRTWLNRCGEFHGSEVTKSSGRLKRISRANPAVPVVFSREHHRSRHLPGFVSHPPRDAFVEHIHSTFLRRTLLARPCRCMMTTLNVTASSTNLKLEWCSSTKWWLPTLGSPLAG